LNASQCSVIHFTSQTFSQLWLKTILEWFLLSHDLRLKCVNILVARCPGMGRCCLQIHTKTFGHLVVKNYQDTYMICINATVGTDLKMPKCIETSTYLHRCTYLLYFYLVQAYLVFPIAACGPCVLCRRDDLCVGNFVKIRKPENGFS
jgi:hypothetical protein